MSILDFYSAKAVCMASNKKSNYAVLIRPFFPVLVDGMPGGERLMIQKTFDDIDNADIPTTIPSINNIYSQLSPSKQTELRETESYLPIVFLNMKSLCEMQKCLAWVQKMPNVNYLIIHTFNGLDSMLEQISESNVILRMEKLGLMLHSENDVNPNNSFFLRMCHKAMKSIFIRGNIARDLQFVCQLIETLTQCGYQEKISIECTLYASEITPMFTDDIQKLMNVVSVCKLSYFKISILNAWDVTHNYNIDIDDICFQQLHENYLLRHLEFENNGVLSDDSNSKLKIISSKICDRNNSLHTNSRFQKSKPCFN